MTTLTKEQWIIVGAVILMIIIGGLGYYGVEQRNADLRARPSSQLTIYWQNKEAYLGIDIQRKDSDTAPWRMVASVAGTAIQYTNRGLARNTKYCYQLVAKKQTETMLSNIMCATSP